MTLLTTKQVQDLFRVDRSTIYRMAEDGRLPAIKVGRQWRFPADKVEALLGDNDPTRRAKTPAGDNIPLEAVLQPETAQAIADLTADLLDIMAVVTDMEGRALTTVANPCGYFNAIYQTEYSLDRCSEGWRRLGQELDLEPHFVPSHLGFLCARSFIRQGTALVGMVIVGGVAPAEWPPDEPTLAAIADDVGAPVDLIRAHSEAVFWIDQPHQEWILRNLSRVSDLISHLIAERGRLVGKLQAIAALVKATPTTN